MKWLCNEAKYKNLVYAIFHKEELSFRVLVPVPAQTRCAGILLYSFSKQNCELQPLLNYQVITELICPENRNKGQRQNETRAYLENVNKLPLSVSAVVSGRQGEGSRTVSIIIIGEKGETAGITTTKHTDESSLQILSLLTWLTDWFQLDLSRSRLMLSVSDNQ